MPLTLGRRAYDLAATALVVGVSGAPRELLAQGADLVEPEGPGPWDAVPVWVTAGDDAALDQALTPHVVLVHLPAPTTAALRRCAEAGVAVLVPAGAVDQARAVGLPADRVVADTLFLDVTGHDCPVAAMAVGMIRGARIIRTAHVRGARRIADVLAAILEAG